MRLARGRRHKLPIAYMKEETALTISQSKYKLRKCYKTTL